MTAMQTSATDFTTVFMTAPAEAWKGLLHNWSAEVPVVDTARRGHFDKEVYRFRRPLDNLVGAISAYSDRFFERRN
jgi:hypothetical protein